MDKATITFLMGLGFLYCFVVMLLCWLYQLKNKNAGVVDLGWVLCLMLLAGLYSFGASGYTIRRAVIFTLVFLWGCRLGGLLLIRLIKEKEEDKRYQDIRREWGASVNAKFFFLFQFEALLAVVLSLPFIIISLNPAPHLAAIEVVGIFLWIVSIAGEATADYQLSVFKSNPATRGKVCQSGLWNYSRHPNYFFEWLIWVSFFIMALGSPYGWLGIISPVLMFFFLMKVTGVPMAEAQSLKSKGDLYREYQRTTSFFIPWFKKK